MVQRWWLLGVPWKSGVWQVRQLPRRNVRTLALGVRYKVLLYFFVASRQSALWTEFL